MAYQKKKTWKKKSSEEIYKERQEKKNALTATISDKFNELAKKIDSPETKAEIEKMLKTSSQFHNYSFNNQMLIHAQAYKREMEVTYLNSFDRWKKVPCENGKISVQKGNKGFKVFVPTPVTEWKRDEAGELIKDADGKKIPERDDDGKIKKIMAFSVGNVFDVSQTNAAELGWKPPSLKYDLGEDLLNQEQYEELRDKISKEFQVKVIDSEECPVRGRINFMENRIEILTKDRTPSKKTASLFHELGHKMMHEKAVLAGEISPKDLESRSTAEGQAEGFAYILSSLLGIERKSELYISNWGNTGEMLKESFKLISTNAKKAIKALKLDELKISQSQQEKKTKSVKI